ncbi:MAG: AAA family ATPase [Coriobacteriia bacterium]|nr:AAA family ATPase [Coriobacteriia bacterium]
MIERIRLKNFKVFKGEYVMDLKPGLNIIVGANEVGKSTILEAIHLCLTGIIGGRYLGTELTQYLFNNDVVSDYLSSLRAGSPQQPPEVQIELFFHDRNNELALFMGDGNSNEARDAKGITLSIKFNEDYRDEYQELVNSGEVKSLPIEYYEAKWSTFARKDNITLKSIPIKSVMVDSTISRYQNGSDVYVSRIIQQSLDVQETVRIAQAYRNARDSFQSDEAVQSVGAKLSGATGITDKKIDLSVEQLSRNAWESSLVTYIDEVPFQYVGKGEQSVMKTIMALSEKRALSAAIILMEEPECHLAYTRLSSLVRLINDNYGDKQFIITTHESLVANKLNLGNLILMGNGRQLYLRDLTKGTQRYFEKLAGYDTLRLILSEKVILVEGSSDELIVQKAYMDMHNGRLPIEDGIDVIAVGTSFLRFLEIAEILGKNVDVVTDNDGNPESLEKKYARYLGINQRDNIHISYEKSIRLGNNEKLNYNTLENELLIANGLESVNRILNTYYMNEDKLLTYMKNNKTDCALKFFETEEPCKYPPYILEVVGRDRDE